MNLYLTIRWGHADSPDGPDGDDTLFLVRALSVADAGRMSDELLVNLPVTSLQSNRRVQPFCHLVVEIGHDNCPGDEGRVILGPVIASPGGRNWANHPTWMREDSIDEWREQAEYFR